MLYLSVALMGAIGSLLRYFLTQSFETQNLAFPYLTFLINIVGSFFIAVIFIMAQEKGQIPNSFSIPLMAGLLGGFTTFSAFSLETMKLFESGAWRAALGYAIASPTLCILSAACGFALTRRLF